MKKIFFFFFIVSISSFSQTQYRFDINNIDLPMNNKGILADVNIEPLGPGGRYGVSKFLFSSGFFVSGYNADTLWASGMATASLVENFLAGNVDSLPANPLYKIYVNQNSSTPNYTSWQEYSNAVSIGADFYDGNDDGIYDPTDLNNNGQWDKDEDKPDILGDEITWCVYNDGIPGNQRTRFAGVDPVGLEIHQSLFGYSATNALGNVIFIRYKLINSGKYNEVLDSVFFSVWADPDLGQEFTDDAFGSDTLRHSVYVYNGDDSDPAYGNAVPSFFIRLLEGPHSYIPGETFIDINSNDNYDEGIDTPLDTAVVRRGKDLGIKYLPGAKNLDVTATTHYIQSDPLRGDPNSEFQARNYIMGRLKDGTPINPCVDNRGSVFGGVNCDLINKNFWYSGDPIAHYGWINVVPDDQRMMINTGPFDLKVGEPVSITIAYIVGQGSNVFASVVKAREYAEYTHNFYLSNFGEYPVGVEDDFSLDVPTNFKLEQNYPNPFNPSTKISWQSPVSDWQTLKVYDLLGREVATLVDEYRDAGNYEVDFPSVETLHATSLPSGVYFYQLKTGDYIETKKMILLK